MTKMMTAVVRENNSKKLTIIKSEYETKQTFIDDLHANGYTVVGRITVEGEDNERTKLYNLGVR